MPTPKGFGDRMHFDGDGCDDDSIRHRMGLQATDLKKRVFIGKPRMGTCMVEKEWGPCGMPVMEEEFDCGRHGTNRSL